MDPGRRLILAALGLALGAGAARADVTLPPRAAGTMAPIPNPPALSGPAAGPGAIAAANRTAATASRADRFVGGLQVFAYAPGRVYEVWTAPLRVTLLTLDPAETVVSLAAGDTLRWQIVETAAGDGPSRRVHILVKPLARGLETNLVLATSRRIYLVRLRSGPPQAFNPAVAWTADALDPPPPAGAATPAPPATPAAAPPSAADMLEADYRITVRGRRPPWTPTGVIRDGTRTLITFPAALRAGEAPALFALAPDGSTQMVNYRQHGALYIVDGVLERAELRLGDRTGQRVTLTRQAGDRP